MAQDSEQQHDGEHCPVASTNSPSAECFEMNAIHTSADTTRIRRKSSSSSSSSNNNINNSDSEVAKGDIEGKRVVASTSREIALDDASTAVEDMFQNHYVKIEYSETRFSLKKLWSFV
ncbi:hypothetical protein EV177_009634, partial [Coemansia sp. RSA 1804]